MFNVGLCNSVDAERPIWANHSGVVCNSLPVHRDDQVCEMRIRPDREYFTKELAVFSRYKSRCPKMERHVRDVLFNNKVFLCSAVTVCGPACPV